VKFKYSIINAGKMIARILLNPKNVSITDKTATFNNQSQNRKLILTVIEKDDKNAPKVQNTAVNTMTMSPVICKARDDGGFLTGGINVVACFDVS